MTFRAELALQKYEWARKNAKQLPDLFELNSLSGRVDEIMVLLGTQYDIEEPGLIKAVVSILVTFLPSPEVAFSTSCDLLDRQEWFVAPQTGRHRMKLYSFKTLVKNYLPKSAEDLDNIGGFAEEFLNKIFLDFFMPLLPIPDAAKIFDAFLLEGYKVLHRFGLALLFLCRENIGTNLSGHEFWDIVRRRCHSDIKWSKLHATAYAIGKNTVLSQFSAKNVSLSRAVILKYELEAKIALGESLMNPLNLKFVNSFTKQHGLGSRADKNLDLDSRILNMYSLERLRMFLPETALLNGFKLIFSTERDGWNISTMYTKSDGLYPCLLLIKTLLEESIVGVFITSSISPPSNSIRGDGNCFVCRLDGSSAACYRWIGKIVNASANHSKFTENQFAIFNKSYITIGGSEDSAENALYIDADLSTCFFGSSDTFGNPCLAANGLNGQPAIISAVELFCGTNSVTSAITISGGDYSKRLWKTDKLVGSEKEADTRSFQEHDGAINHEGESLEYNLCQQDDSVSITFQHHQFGDNEV
jgi:hypothetical protein